MITEEAHAKVNLTLEVLGRRGDGYHDIASIMQTVDLHDTVTLVPADAISLEGDHQDIDPGDNLVLAAARLLADETACRAGAKMALSKRIPVSAGLGGGSSDAAATLRGLNRLWDLRLSLDDLAPLAAKLGSDVPFFLRGGTAMVQGRGESVRPLRPADLEWMVLLIPPIEMSRKTATMYSALTEANHTRGALTRKLEARIRGGGDVPPQFLFNAFDAVAFDVFPDLRSYWDAMLGLGAREVHLAGSGPALFAPVERREIGTALQLMLEHRHGWDSRLVRAWRPSEGDD